MSKVRGEVPVWLKAPAPTVDKTEESDREGERGGAPERPGGDADTDEFGQVWRGEVIDGV